MRLTIGLFILLFIGCKTADVQVDGKYISEIKRNEVKFEDGSSLNLISDEGAKIIYLIRHAEKDTLPSRKNPILTKEGYERSYHLANMFKESRIDAVYSTLYNRTMHTVDSLVSMKGLATKIFHPEDMKIEVPEMLEHKTENIILISGHSNTTPAMAGVFMGESIFDKGFDHDDYDNMLVINVLPTGEKKLYQLRYK